MKRSPLTIVVALLLIAIFGLMLFVFQVRQSEVAVVTFFEKMETGGVQTNPGPHLQWPWPMERVYKLDERIHSLEDKSDPITLPDQNLIQLRTFVGWKISDPAKFFQKFENGSVVKAEEQLQGMVRSAKLDVASQHNFSDFLSADPNQIKLTNIENEILQNARQKLVVGDYGIQIEFVQFENLELPTTVSQAVFDRMKAERSKLVIAISSSATEQSIKIKSQADKEASKLLADADARAKEIRGEGQSAMIQSLQVMAQRPEFAKFLMDLDMMEELSKDKTTWILDHNTRGLELLQSANPTGAVTNAPVPAHN